MVRPRSPPSAVEHPDLVLLDVEMPVMDGLVTLRQLRARGHTMPVIMCSSLTQRGAKVTIEALASGASDYVAKPAGQSGREQALQSLAQELLPKIHALTNRAQRPPVLPHLRAPCVAHASPAAPPAEKPAPRHVGRFGAWRSAFPPAAQRRSICFFPRFQRTSLCPSWSCSTCLKSLPTYSPSD